MAIKPVPAVGAKDLQDFTTLPRAPELSFLQKQALPPAPRPPDAAPTTLFHKLSLFVARDFVRWARDYLRHRLGPRHAFATYETPADDDGVYPLGDDPVRIAIAGDWGSGTDEAFRVAERMSERDPHFTIHLGDVYFVGDPAEVKENFLGQANPRHDYTPCTWPPGSRGAFALNGNHEMYARGIGYFDLILPALGLAAEGKGKPQKASYFCLQNAHWRVIALDTGYNSIGVPLIEQIIKPDCALPEPLLDWLRDTLNQRDDRRGIVLLSHHQYFSRFDDCYARPAQQLAEFIDRPVLWLWGHEHRLAIYDKHRIGGEIEAYGRCVGHGGMPVELPPAKPTHDAFAAEFVDRRLYLNKEDLTVGVNGFAALTFEGDALKLDYVDVAGKLVCTEAWRTDENGRLSRSDFRVLEAQPDDGAPVS